MIGGFYGVGYAGNIHGGVNTYAELPSPESQAGFYYIVKHGSGVYLINRKQSGIYYSDGITWERLDDNIKLFNTTNFRLYDNSDNTKQVAFNSTALSSNTVRTMSFRNTSGTIALEESGRFGSYSEGNYSSFETDGTLKFNGDATVFDDLRILPSDFVRAGISDPSLQEWQPGGSGTALNVFCFNQGQYGFFTIQIPHSYKLGTSIYAHVHWTPRDRGEDEENKTVAWKIDYTIAGINGVFIPTQTIDLTDTCTGVNDKHEMTQEIEIPSTQITSMSSMIVGKIYRDSGDTWVGTTADAPAILELDFHYEVDTVGSRERMSK